FGRDRNTGRHAAHLVVLQLYRSADGRTESADADNLYGVLRPTNQVDLEVDRFTRNSFLAAANHFSHKAACTKDDPVDRLQFLPLPERVVQGAEQFSNTYRSEERRVGKGC